MGDERNAITTRMYAMLADGLREARSGYYHLAQPKGVRRFLRGGLVRAQHKQDGDKRLLHIPFFTVSGLESGAICGAPRSLPAPWC